MLLCLTLRCASARRTWLAGYCRFGIPSTITVLYCTVSTLVCRVVCCSREPAQLNPDSLPAIRLLMREMEVAVREEDYEQAARLRDHPWMRLAEDINMHR